MLQAFESLLATYRGVSADQVGSMVLRLPESRYQEPSRINGFHGDLLQAVVGLPDIESAALASNLPAGLVGARAREFRIESRAAPAPGDTPLADVRMVSDGYLDTVRIPLLEGRFFDARDADAPASGADFAVVVSERLARQYWPDESPIGHRLRLIDLGGTEPWRRIVGVVGDVRQNWFERERPTVYVPALQYASRWMYLIVRGRSDVEAALSAASSEVHALDPGLPIFERRPMSVAVDASLAGVQEAAAMMTVFGVLALLLAGLGVYGVMAHTVGMREKEIGIRLALGAPPAAVLWSVLAQGLSVLVIGLAAGIPAAVALARVWSALLFGTAAAAPAVVVSVAMLVATAVLVACSLPARVAMRIDPLRALRCE